MLPDFAREPARCPPPVPAHPRPGFRLPLGTCDTHIHVFGPAENFRLLPERSYTPAVANLPDYRNLMLALGIDRAVLVQPSVYGTDNSLLLAALEEGNNQLRGVVVIPVDQAESQVRQLDRAGARGVRINPRYAGGIPLSSAKDLARHISPFGWHLQVHLDLEQTSELPELVANIGIPIVIDHFGLVSPANGPNASGLTQLLRLLDTGACYVKLSAPYRLRLSAHSDETIRALVGTLVATRPDRLLWATDWPHVECWQGTPDDGDLAGLVETWFPSPAVRAEVLVRNPDRLYWGAA